MTSVSLVVAACGGGGGTGDAAPDVVSDADGGDTCVPTTCVLLGAECGDVDLGCDVIENCGACGGEAQCISNTCVPCGDAGCDGGTPECTDGTYLADCPVLECEEPTGCAAGRCVYTAVDCSLEADCPQRECQATALPAGGYENLCVELVRPPCGSCPGPTCGVCVGAACVVTPPAATFVSGAMVTTLFDTSVTGNLTYFLPESGEQCVGSVCVAGSIVP